METLNFEKDENVKIITLSQLKQTCSLTDSGAKLPASRPLEHFQLIETVCERLDKANIKYEMDPIWVAKGDSNRVPILDPDKTGAIKSWIFSRLVTRLQMIFGDNEKYNPAIAIGYNVKGLTLGMGINTRICSNQSIFGNNLTQTWGKQSVDFQKVFNVLGDWLSKYDETFANNVKLLDAMEEIQLIPQQVNEVLGQLQMEAVKNAYITPGLDAPFNIGQMSTFSKNLYNKHISKQDIVSLSDIYNVGTDLLKPKTTDIVDIWANNNVFSNFIVNKFALNLN